MSEALGRPSLGPIRNPIRFALDCAGVAFWAAAAVHLDERAGPGSPGPETWLMALSQAALFAVSAAYHGGPWSPVWKRRWQRADHSMIYLKIAGSVTALLLLFEGTGHATAWIAATWAIAIGGVAQKVGWPDVHEKACIPFQLLQACSALPVFATLAALEPRRPLALVGVGTACYVAGLAIFLCQRPRLWPRWFSFHELFHVLLLVASLALYTLLADAVDASARGLEPPGTSAERVVASAGADGPIARID